MRTSSEMYPLVAIYLSSGLSRKEFCREHGIAPSTFLYWEEQYLAAGRPSIAVDSGFIPMDVGSPVCGYELEIILSPVLRLQFRSLPPVSWLKELGVGC